ncbi:MAG: DUF3592 domain-containing protein [Alphaproteobacteria bacterium]|nr:DUF3592 domain-containing protein [Alphaproteobacteria bacterium]
MGSRIFMTLFALPFLGVGIWATYSIISSFIEAEAMKQWAPVQAQVLKGGVEKNTDDEGSTTYRAYAEYKYNYQGQDYTASRVSIDSGADNIGHAHEERGAALAVAASEGRSIEVYVDPAMPYSAVIYRDIRWGMVGFKALFAVLFGGVGIGVIAAAFYKKRRLNPAALGIADSPWLANTDWQSNEIKSGSKGAMYFAWIFAAVWNLVSAPLPFMLREEVVEKQNYAALIALLFPLVGIGLLVWAVRRTLEWKRFGASPVALDPFPAAIGGQAGGTFELPVPFDSAHRFRITLACVHSFKSGSGKNRSRREKNGWEQSVIGYAEPGLYGTRVQFRFDIPAGLPPSDALREGDAYDLWRLSLQADLPGADINRDYEIPAYPGTARSRIDDRAAAAIAQATKTDAEGGARARITMQGDAMFYPMGRNAFSGLIGIVFGAVFAGAGIFLFMKENAWFGGAIFGGVGLLVFTGCIYAVGNSLTVKRDSMGGGVETVRRLFGMPVKRQYAALDDIVSLAHDSSSAGQKNGRQVKFYRVFGKLKQGGDITLGESFEGEAEAGAALAFIREKLGLRL